MSIRTAAAREEEAELNELREQADRATAELAQTLTELTRRITVVRRPSTTFCLPQPQSSHELDAITWTCSV